MSNIIMGTVIVLVNVTLAILIDLSWATVIGVIPGGILIGWGLREHLIERMTD